MVLPSWVRKIRSDIAGFPPEMGGGWFVEVSGDNGLADGVWEGIRCIFSYWPVIGMFWPGVG